MVLRNKETIGLSGAFLFAFLFNIICTVTTCDAFSVHMSASGNEIYGIKNSGWSSTQWNWGSARGTGHDCAAICRRQYSSKASRLELVENLLQPPEDPASRKPENFEEVKLILGLAWQNGRWDGSDGGPGGYADVLRYMAEANRYETAGSEEECAKRFVMDLQDRFELLDSVDAVSMELREMRSILDDDSDMDYARRKASGLVLEAMGFVDKGL